MEIGPIPGIRAIAAVKARPVDSDISAVFDIDALARGGGDARAEVRKKASGAEEEEEDDLTQAGEAGPEFDFPGEATASNISLFA